MRKKIDPELVRLMAQLGTGKTSKARMDVLEHVYFAIHAINAEAAKHAWSAACNGASDLSKKTPQEALVFLRSLHSSLKAERAKALYEDITG